MKRQLISILALSICLLPALTFNSSAVLEKGHAKAQKKGQIPTYVGSCNAPDTPPVGDLYDIYVTTGTNTIVQAFDETDQTLYTASGNTYTSHSGLVFAENCDVYNTNGTVRVYINNQALASN